MGSDAALLDKLLTDAAFQSTLPVWGATLIRRVQAMSDEISIHAPRVGSDGGQKGFIIGSVDISIHAPRVGSDPYLQSPHIGIAISIHAPRVGSDYFRGSVET